MAGVICVEVNNGYPISNWFEKTGKQISESFQNQTPVPATTQQGEEFSISSFIEPLKEFAGWIWDYASKIPTFFETTVKSIIYFFQNLPTIFKTASGAVDQVKKVISNHSEVTGILGKIFNNFPKIVQFFMDDSKSKSLKDILSNSNQLVKIQKALEALSGLDSSSPVKLKEGMSIVDYVGERCIEKIETCADDIKKMGDFFDKAIKSVQSDDFKKLIPNQTNPSIPTAQNKAFELSKAKLDSLLEKRDSFAQEGYEAGLALEIVSQLAGVPLWSGTSALTSLAWALLGKSLVNSSSK